MGNPGTSGMLLSLVRELEIWSIYKSANTNSMTIVPEMADEMEAAKSHLIAVPEKSFSWKNIKDGIEDTAPQKIIPDNRSFYPEYEIVQQVNFALNLDRETRSELQQTSSLLLNTNMGNTIPVENGGHRHAVKEDLKSTNLHNSAVDPETETKNLEVFKHFKTYDIDDAEIERFLSHCYVDNGNNAAKGSDHGIFHSDDNLDEHKYENMQIRFPAVVHGSSEDISSFPNEPNSSKAANIILEPSCTFCRKTVLVSNREQEAVNKFLPQPSQSLCLGGIPCQSNCDKGLVQFEHHDIFSAVSSHLESGSSTNHLSPKSAATSSATYACQENSSNCAQSLMDGNNVFTKDINERERLLLEMIDKEYDMADHEHSSETRKNTESQRLNTVSLTTEEECHGVHNVADEKYIENRGVSLEMMDGVDRVDHELSTHIIKLKNTASQKLLSLSWRTEEELNGVLHNGAHTVSFSSFGSISLHSDGSGTSAGSFAFPVLNHEDCASPAKIPAGGNGSGSYKKKKHWFCCYSANE